MVAADKPALASRPRLRVLSPRPQAGLPPQRPLATVDLPGPMRARSVLRAPAPGLTHSERRLIGGIVLAVGYCLLRLVS